MPKEKNYKNFGNGKIGSSFELTCLCPSKVHGEAATPDVTLFGERASGVCQSEGRPCCPALAPLQEEGETPEAWRAHSSCWFAGNGSIQSAFSSLLILLPRGTTACTTLHRKK